MLLVNDADYILIPDKRAPDRWVTSDNQAIFVGTLLSGRVVYNGYFFKGRKLAELCEADLKNIRTVI